MSDYPDDLLHISHRIEQCMGQKWMDSRQQLTTAALFDEFLPAILRTQRRLDGQSRQDGNPERAA